MSDLSFGQRAILSYGGFFGFVRLEIWLVIGLFVRGHVA